MRLSLQWKVLLGYLIIAGAGMGMAGWLALDALEASDLNQLRLGLTAQARIAARLFATSAGSGEESGQSQWPTFITESIRMPASSAARLICSASRGSGAVLA